MSTSKVSMRFHVLSLSSYTIGSYVSLSDETVSPMHHNQGIKSRPRSTCCSVKLNVSGACTISVDALQVS